MDGVKAVEGQRGLRGYSSPRRFATLLVLSLFVALFCQADTTQLPPVRGQMRLEISKIEDTNMPPRLPKDVNRARLRWVHDDYYKLENIDPGDIIFTPNRPTVQQTKGGWRITF